MNPQLLAETVHVLTDIFLTRWNRHESACVVHYKGIALRVLLVIPFSILSFSISLTWTQTSHVVPPLAFFFCLLLLQTSSRSGLVAMFSLRQRATIVWRIISMWFLLKCSEVREGTPFFYSFFLMFFVLVRFSANFRSVPLLCSLCCWYVTFSFVSALF